MKKGDDLEIVRWREEEKQSFRDIGRILGISHVAVRKRYIKTAKHQASRLLVNVDVQRRLLGKAKVQAAREIGRCEVNEENQSKVEASTHGKNTEARLLTKANIQMTSTELSDKGKTQVITSTRKDCQAMETITNNNIPLKEVEPTTAGLKSASRVVTKEEYLIHKQTGRVVRKGTFNPRGELVPYTPPKFLRKVDGPNKGKIFPWTFYLAQRIDMMPFEDDPSSLPINKVTNQQEIIG